MQPDDPTFGQQYSPESERELRRCPGCGGSVITSDREPLGLHYSPADTLTMARQKHLLYDKQTRVRACDMSYRWWAEAVAIMADRTERTTPGRYVPQHP